MRLKPLFLTTGLSLLFAGTAAQAEPGDVRPLFSPKSAPLQAPPEKPRAPLDRYAIPSTGMVGIRREKGGKGKRRHRDLRNSPLKLVPPVR